MSADNLLAVLRTPKAEGEGFEFRIGRSFMSGRPWDWRCPDDDRWELEVTDYREFLATFARSEVYASYAAARSVLAEEEDGGMPPEYGTESLELADTFDQLKEKAAKWRRKRRTRTQRLESKRAYERKAIRWEPKMRRFRLGWHFYTRKQVYAMLARATAANEDVLFRYLERSFGSSSDSPVLVSRGYVAEMLKFVAEHGWFWDAIESRWLPDKDHEFNREHITPGLHWKAVQDALEIACQLESGPAPPQPPPPAGLSDGSALDRVKVWRTLAADLLVRDLEGA